MERTVQCQWCGHYVSADKVCLSAFECEGCPGPKVPTDIDPEVDLKVESEDPVEGPEHYLRMPITPAEFIYKNEIGFMEGNVIKYVCRYDAKNGLEDLRKARKYLELLAKWKYGEGL